MNKKNSLKTTILIFYLIAISCFQCNADKPPIDRHALVTMHNIEWNDLEGQIPHSNEEFCFNVDRAGLQIFGGNTMLHWDWHSCPLLEGVAPDQILSTETFQKEHVEKTWIIADLFNNVEEVTVLGDPKIIDSSYGKAVQFDGVDDGFLLERMPLKDLSEFTVEMIIRFDSGGNEEQRYFHAGTVKQDRVLMEMRSDDATWYLDGMFESKGKWVVLMDQKLPHPLDKWYHIAFTVKDGEQATFVNGKKELEGTVEFSPIEEGATSIGVRQNKISWFKGAIYCIRITDKVIDSCEFMDLL